MDGGVFSILLFVASGVVDWCHVVLTTFRVHGGLHAGNTHRLTLILHDESSSSVLLLCIIRRIGLAVVIAIVVYTLACPSNDRTVKQRCLLLRHVFGRIGTLMFSRSEYS